MRKIGFILLMLYCVQLTICAQNISDAEALFDQADEYYYDAKLLGKAKNTYLEALNILNQCNATNTLLYFQLLEELASISNEERDYLTAAQFMERSIAVENDTVKRYVADDEGPNSPLRKLSDYYANAGLWEKAFQIKQNRLFNKMNLRETTDFDLALEDYMYWVDNANYYKFAIRILKGLDKSIGNNTYYNYWMGVCYLHLRDYDNAMVYFEKAKSDFGRAKVFAAKGELNKAIEIQKRIVLEEQENRGHRIYISGHPPYSAYLSVLAGYYILNGEYDNAIDCEEKNIVSPTTYINLGKAYAGKQEWRKAIEYTQKAYEMPLQEATLASTLADLSQYSFTEADKQNLQNYISEIIRCSREELLSSFQELTYEERSNYINKYTELLNNKIPMYAFYTHSDSIIEASYNASLMMKGALLSSENGVKRIVEESEDNSLKDLWNRMKAYRYIIGKELEMDSQSRKLDIDSLQNVAYALKDSLVVKCKEYGDITQSMKMTWKDIRAVLRPEDLAIEFLSFPTNNDSVMYIALSLRKDSDRPKMTILFEEKQLNSISDPQYYQCKDMSELVWDPLLSEFKGVKNVYFSPSGALYNIGIEYLPGVENYNIYRLSSTRVLVTKSKQEPRKSAILYGGLNYNAKTDTININMSLALLKETFKEHADVRGLGLRGSKEYLKYTKVEVDIIGNELRKAKWLCLMDTAALGTEESFKALSGRKIGCLHIATHGFYYNKEKAYNRGYKFLLLDDQMVSEEDMALTRSGLILSGANHILENKQLPDNVEDGILTAKEISDIDLRDLDMVVLSACQTGLGDITQSEGVFGLQRGFKKAGANTIIMSLWKVNDEATQILMTQFYKQLISGQSKYQSLLLAQHYLREYRNSDGEQCYNSPQYWASFILLDGY